MSDIRQFLRYEIPGYILFIYTFLLILPFINPSKIEGLLPVLLQISISGFIIAIPIGWLLYQIFNESCIEKHYCKESVKLIKNWSKENNLFLDDYWYEELLNVVLYSSNKETTNNKNINKDIPFDSHLVADTLRGYWTHYEARWIIAIPVVIISILLAIFAILAGIHITNNASESFLIPHKFSWISIIIYMIICIISCSLYQSLGRIMNEINALEVSFVILRKNQILGIIKTIHDELPVELRKKNVNE